MNKYLVQASAVDLTATTTKTVLAIGTPADLRARLLGFGVSFDGVTASDVPVLVELLRQTTAGTNTSATPQPLDPGSAASQVTAGSDHTVEPTAGSILMPHYVSPNGGILTVQFTTEEAPVLAVSGFLGIRCTAPTDAVNVAAWMLFDC